jgi:hypothetical protein
MDKLYIQDYEVEINEPVILATCLSVQLVIQYKFKIER